MTTTLDNQRLRPLPGQFGVEILRVQVGSGVHGVTVGGQDDRDEMGICIEPAEYVIGLKTFEQWIYRTQPEGVRSGYGDLDLTVYSLRKWCRLALAGNPSILLPLFVPPQEVVTCTEIGNQLRANPDWFLSKHVANRFLGYMTAQREQLMGLRGQKHTNRPELVQKYGFDTKFAYHMVRLGIQGVELLGTGRITLPMPDPYRSWLIGLRRGEHTRDEAIERANDLERELIYLRDNTDLPEEPAREAVDSWLHDVYAHTWQTWRHDT